MTFQPQEAIVAVTLHCNSRCLMCDIWQKHPKREVRPEFYKRLPASLREINLTGGEPFLRPDLPQIVKVIKNRCPKARIVISTNGFLPDIIKRLIPEIVKLDQQIGVRVSLDGLEKTHNQIRRVKNGYKLAMESMEILRRYVKDLGIGFTLMEKNKQELLKVYNFCKRNNWEFSLTLVSDSDIYFGREKINLRPKNDRELKLIFEELIKRQARSLKPKNWLRGWFNQELYNYFLTGKRSLKCQAGKGFFYLDSYGKIFTCHLKPWLLGDLRKQSFKETFDSPKADHYRKLAGQCQGCWMSCSVRSNMKNNWLNVGIDIMPNLLKNLV